MILTDDGPMIVSNSVLGLGFQMGAPKFHDRYCPEQPLTFAQTVVQTYRKSWAPQVPYLWYGLQDAAAGAVWSGQPTEAYGVEYRHEGEHLVAVCQDGSKIWYFHPERSRDQAPWDPRELRAGWTYYAKKNGRWLKIHAFGGLLTENVVQHLARQLLVAAMFKCREEGLPMVLTVHDEIVAEVESGRSNHKMLRQIMEDRPAWAADMKIPIAAETWAGTRYRK